MRLVAIGGVLPGMVQSSASATVNDAFVEHVSSGQAVPGGDVCVWRGDRPEEGGPGRCGRGDARRARRAQGAVGGWVKTQRPRFGPLANRPASRPEATTSSSAGSELRDAIIRVCQFATKRATQTGLQRPFRPPPYSGSSASITAGGGFEVN